MNFKSKNVILIIGNGFDLAHNYKTSYNDFANYIIENILTPAIINSNIHKYEGGLIREHFIKNLNDNMTNNSGNELGSFVNRIIFYKVRKLDSGISDTLKEFSSEIKKIISNAFLGKLFNDQYENWFDIENAYFSELVSIEEKYTTLRQKKVVIKTLNSDLEEIKSILINYLRSIETERNDLINTFFRSEWFDNLEYAYVLNFNYTNSIENYFQPSKHVKINYIHGNLDSHNIVFGYGNDQHSKYGIIKETGIDEYLKYFKTFQYLNDKKYNEIYDLALQHFEDYDVLIIGHSLGQTDKTLLKEILDNDKCQRIHIFKRSDLNDNSIGLKEEFNKLIFSISRIIDNEKDLRVKVLNFEDSQFFP
ncbi:MAG: AbiH family protein [Gilvibacter sp.]